MRVFLAESVEQLARFHDLVAEYEASLPLDLRHDGLEPGMTAFVAEIDGEPCGCVALAESDASTGEVKRLFVKPEFRGYGAARALLAALLERSRERGYARIVLDTHRERLAAAYTLYRSLGFAECEPCGGASYACPTFMELRL
ncbi:MAG TPA: GNAT family N-acetyltransferase [Candidatus Baltobacteraceae bacterium]|nr:GNAT family N-acetyltransferase [Candidatus Baltobacteraceae bacterium]